MTSGITIKSFLVDHSAGGTIRRNKGRVSCVQCIRHVVMLELNLKMIAGSNARYVKIKKLTWQRIK